MIPSAPTTSSAAALFGGVGTSPASCGAPLSHVSRALVATEGLHLTAWAISRHLQALFELSYQISAPRSARPVFPLRAKFFWQFARSSELPASLCMRIIVIRSSQLPQCEWWAESRRPSSNRYSNSICYPLLDPHRAEQRCSQGHEKWNHSPAPRVRSFFIFAGLKRYRGP